MLFDGCYSLVKLSTDAQCSDRSVGIRPDVGQHQPAPAPLERVCVVLLMPEVQESIHDANALHICAIT